MLSPRVWAEESAVLAWPLVLITLLQLGSLEPRYERLDNGLRVVAVEDHTLPLVSVQLWYAVGSAQDPPDKSGLCAVTRAILEHRDDAALRLRGAGLRFESRTERDACYFSTLLPSNFLEYVLKIEAARMEPLVASADMFKQGWNAAASQYADNPDHMLIRHGLAAMFPDHPYQHPPGFVGTSLKDLSPAELSQFVQRWFVPGNATLFVIGDVSTPAVLEQVRRIFGGLEWAEPPQQAEPRPLEPETIRLRLPCEPGITSAALHVAWRTPPLGHFENAAIDVLMHRLLNPIDGSLFERLRAAGYPYDQLVWRHWNARHDGVLWLTLAFAPKGPGSPVPGGSPSEAQQVLDRWMREIEAALAEAETRIPDEIAHNRARALAERDAWRQRMALPDYAWALAEHEVVAGDLLLAEYSVPRVRQVAVPDVQAAAVMLNRSRRIAIECLPAGADAEATSSSARSLPQAPTPAEPRTLDSSELLELIRELAAGAPDPQTAGRHPQVQRTAAGDRVPITTCALPGTLRLTVAAVERYAKVKHDALWCYPAPCYRPPDMRSSEARMMDYASYHGVLLHWAGGPRGRPARYGRIATADPQRALSMLEWFTRLHLEHRRTWPSGVGAPPGYGVFAVGAVEPKDIAECLEHVLPGDDLPSCDEADLPRPAPPARMTLTHTPDEEAKAFVSFVVSLPLATGREAPLSALEARVLATLLGRLPYGIETAGVDSIAPWRSWSVSPNAVVAEATIDPPDVESTVRRLCARLDAIRTEGVPANELATALRFAQAEQLVRLQGPISIIEAISWDRENPWVLDSEVTVEKLSRRLADVIGQMVLGIYIIGGEKAAFERLRKLERAWNEAVQEPPP
jgi:predicted Zn-dependent peptidase